MDRAGEIDPATFSGSRDPAQVFVPQRPGTRVRERNPAESPGPEPVADAGKIEVLTRGAEPWHAPLRARPTEAAGRYPIPITRNSQRRDRFS